MGYVSQTHTHTHTFADGKRLQKTVMMAWDLRKGDVERRVPYTFRNPRNGQTYDFTFVFTENTDDGLETSTDHRPGGQNVGVVTTKYY